MLYGALLEKRIVFVDELKIVAKAVVADNLRIVAERSVFRIVNRASIRRFHRCVEQNCSGRSGDGHLRSGFDECTPALNFRCNSLDFRLFGH